MVQTKKQVKLMTSDEAKMQLADLINNTDYVDKESYLNALKKAARLAIEDRLSQKLEKGRVENIFLLVESSLEHGFAAGEIYATLKTINRLKKSIEDLQVEEK